MTAKYVIGIDLGTTNCVLAYTELGVEHPEVHILEIPQLTAAGTTEVRIALPSFLYLGTDAETSQGSLDVQNFTSRDFCVGEWARQLGAERPDRVVNAAKSWLCHSRVDRHQPILPWGADDSIPKVSPVLASQRYLEHLAATWNQVFPDAPLQEQEVVLTVPASFDASARDLTRQAVLGAGFPDRFIMLEEPQAAIYAWLATYGDKWRKLLRVGDQILVCDVGGGTSDFTLIGVSEEEGELQLRRIAVGNHLLVGGDNMVLSLAHHVAGLFQEKGVALDPWQSVSLWHSCRAAKEVLLARDAPQQHPISILGRGKKLIGGTVKVEVERDLIADYLMNGFFPICESDVRPAKQRTSGFQEIGLPFEADPAVTRHLAAFLQDHGTDGPVQPTHVLFNGGVFKSQAFKQRIMDVLQHWSSETAPELLAGMHDLDHAVARGAAYYGWSTLQGGVRIRGGIARSYYIGIETAGLAIPGAPRPLRALCVVPFGMEEGTSVDVPSDPIGLIVGQPAQFRFFSSAVRKQDQPGSRLSAWTDDDLNETDSLQTTLAADDALAEEHYVPVSFQAKITELGQLELWCVSTRNDSKWKLEFNVREAD